MKITSLKVQFILAAAISFTACKKQDSENAPLTLKSEKSIMALPTVNNFTMSNWMGALSNDLNLAQLSIPGTHDSGARNEPISGTAKTQNLSIAEQLTAGVRYLDIRCRHIGNAFTIHHGAIYQNLNFDDVLNACISFLNNNPTETIIMSVKEEHTPTDNTRSFEQTFDAYVAQNASKWDLGNGISTLGSVRGKIKLLRRFSAGTTKGIDATNWADNTTFEINNTAANLKIQDYYKVEDLNAKWTKVESLLNEAKNSTENRLYVNYGSGYKPGIFGIPNINTVANSVNPKINTYFTGAAHGRYGIIPLDFIDATRSQLIVNTNF